MSIFSETQVPAILYRIRAKKNKPPRLRFIENPHTSFSHEQMFANEQALDAYLVQQQNIDSWVIQDARDKKNPRFFYKKHRVLQGEIETFFDQTAFYQMLSRDYRGNWKVQDSRGEISHYMLDTSGWFIIEFQVFTTETAFQAALQKKSIQQVRRIMTSAAVLGAGYVTYRYFSGSTTGLRDLF